jgi:hypothetical protein
LPTIDLTAPLMAAVSTLDGLPRRVALTLPELQLVAARAGGAPLPFDVAEAAEAPSLEGRLGASRATTEDGAYRTALGSLNDPETSLARRGLLAGGVLDDGLAGAVGLLATPEYAVDVDVAVPGVQVKAWHRATGEAVATLATCDGLVFELAWFHPSVWPTELSRVGVLPEDLPVRESKVPATLELPYELADAAVEAASAQRGDLLPVLVAQHSGAVVADGRALTDGEAVAVLQALSSEAQGRLRALVADLTVQPTTVVGVRSWVMLADGWRTLRPHGHGETAKVELRAVAPSELAADLAPVLAGLGGPGGLGAPFDGEEAAS